MMFEIEGFIIFDTVEATLVNQLTGDCVELPQTPVRLLAELLNHRGKTLSRDEIFQSVFDKFGARSSNSNLNQYISTLRRNLSDLGIGKEIIITVPRVGFKISDKAIVKNHATNPQPVEEEFASEDVTTVPAVRWRYAFIMLFPPILILILYFFKTPQVHSSEVTSTVVEKQCVLHVFSTLSVKALKKNLASSGVVLDCSEPKEIYIYSRQANSDLGENSQLLMMECEKKSRSCTSFYTREIKNV